MENAKRIRRVWVCVCVREYATQFLCTHCAFCVVHTKIWILSFSFWNSKLKFTAQKRKAIYLLLFFLSSGLFSMYVRARNRCRILRQRINCNIYRITKLSYWSQMAQSQSVLEFHVNDGNGFLCCSLAFYGWKKCAECNPKLSFEK